MINPPMRSPGEKVGGLYHFGRMFDKIRLHFRGKLPEEYRPNYGWVLGLDGFCCGFLGVAFEDVEAQVAAGGNDEEILEWCFATGMRPNKIQRRVWNEYARKLGWDDAAGRVLRKVKEEDATTERDDLSTIFKLIDFREGRVEGGKTAE